MLHFKSHFEFNKPQRSGILFVCALIVGLLCVLKFYSPQPSLLLDICSPQIVKQQAYVDSLRQEALEKKSQSDIRLILISSQIIGRIP